MRPSRILFGAAVFLGSFLLFLLEPIAAKQLLPVFGGSAAVWVTCLVFFQTALLAGYAYAHWLTRRAQSNWQGSVHISLLVLAIVSACIWSIGRYALSHGSGHPVSAIFGALTISIGLPFLMLAATSPLMQVWLARIEAGGIRYRLFALSNLASLLALLLYPTLIEPHLTLKAQRLSWSFGFIVFAVIAATLAVKAQVPAEKVADDPASMELISPPASWRDKLLWLLLPMGAAMQLSAVTVHLTANLAAIPLLWILPLAVYLVTLILAFQFPDLLPRGIVARFLVVMLAGLGLMLAQVEVTLPIRVGIIFFLIELFFACLFCHAEAYRLRPGRPSESTLFYLIFAAGGALGSFLVGIASPLIFRFNYDLAVSFLVIALLAVAVFWSNGWAQRILWATASVLLMYFVVQMHRSYQWGTIVAERNFYGSLRVRQTDGVPDYTLRTLTNGNIQHGTQMFSPQRMRIPTSYYAEDSGVGVALRNCCVGRAKNVGVVGLGAGTVAAYGQRGDRMRFYEINPAVLPIAQNVFTYLRDSGAQISFADGDARTSLADEAPQKFDVLVIDAFSGDAIPLHLLTREAIELYKKHLAPGGILAFHVSNQHVSLQPEVAQLAKSAGMLSKTVASLPNESRGEFTATWVLVTNNEDFFALPEVAGAGASDERDAGGPAVDG